MVTKLLPFFLNGTEFPYRCSHHGGMFNIKCWSLSLSLFVSSRKFNFEKLLPFYANKTLHHITIHDVSIRRECSELIASLCFTTSCSVNAFILFENSGQNRIFFGHFVDFFILPSLTLSLSLYSFLFFLPICISQRMYGCFPLFFLHFLHRCQCERHAQITAIASFTLSLFFHSVFCIFMVVWFLPIILDSCCAHFVFFFLNIRSILCAAFSKYWDHRMATLNEYYHFSFYSSKFA